MRGPFLFLFSTFLACLFIFAFAGCGPQRNAPPPSPADSSSSEVSEETLRTLVLRLNKRYENVDSRIAENRERIDALEKELIALRQSFGLFGPARRPSTVEKTRTRASDDVSKKTSFPGTTSGVDPKRLYETALTTYSQGDYPTAISRFQEFVNAFPSSDLADNAFYWIGESYYAKEEFERAISSFLKVVDRYPQGNKVPDAIFKVGISYTRLKDPEKAREYLTRVMDNYPFSDAAQKAKVRLDQLE